MITRREFTRMEDRELGGSPDGYVEGEDEDCQPGEVAQDVCPEWEHTIVRERVVRPVPELGSLEEELASEAWRDEAVDEEERGEV